MCEEYGYVGMGRSWGMEEGRRMRENGMIVKWFIEEGDSGGMGIDGVGFRSWKYVG